MLRSVLVGSAVAISIVGGAYAQKRTVYGAGMISCGEWQQFRLSNNKSNIYQAEAWIDGFLSGYNSSYEGSDFLTAKANPIAFYAWLDNHCREKPLDVIAEGIISLKNELMA